MDTDMVKSLNSIMSEFECKWNSPACNIIIEYLSIQSGDWSYSPYLKFNLHKLGN